jgi:ketosteroid isomerase-like protein
MYHAIVKRIAVQNFLRVNRKDYAAILKSCSPDVHHRFGGHHALGGERHDREALGRWFERLGRLAPTLQLTVHDVWVKGGPWNTTVIMRWSAVQDLPDGSPYNNHGVHIIRCIGARCSISTQTRTLNLLLHPCRYGPHTG